MADTNNIKCRVYTSFEELNNIRNEWDNFVLNTGADIFLTFDWCKVWWQYYGSGRVLRIYIFRSNNEIVGILPMFFEIIWLLLPVKIGKIVGSDFTLAQFTLPIRKEYYDLCLKPLFEDLKILKWHIIILGPLAGISSNNDAHSFIDAFHKTIHDNLNIHISDGMYHTYFKLHETWEKHLSSLKKSHRKEIVHKYNLLERYHPGSIANLKPQLADEKNFDIFYKDFANMHQCYWNGFGKLGHFGDWPEAYQFHQTMAKTQLHRDRLRLIQISLNDEVLGYVYAYKLGNRYYAFLNARTQSGKYADISLGAIIFTEYAKLAIDEKVTLIDSMRGKYEHKLKLGGELFTIKKIYLTPKSLSNKIRINIFFKVAGLLNLFYYRIWFLRLADKFPFKRSPLWKIWIRSTL